MASLCRTIVFAALAALFLWGCGGKQSMASKSAAAYADAQRKGIPVSGGEHGGHHNAAAPQTTAEAHEHEAMPGMEHRVTPSVSEGPGGAGGAMPAHGATHPSGPLAHARGDMNMSGAEHGASMPEMQHGGRSPAMQHGSMPGMKHDSSMAGMQHGAQTPAMQHEPSMQHGAAMPGMQHGAPAANVTVDTAAPRSSGAMATVQPAATLRTDDFDAPLPVSQSEAAKASGGATTHTKGHH